MYKVVVSYLWPQGSKSLAIFWIHTTPASTLSITAPSHRSLSIAENGTEIGCHPRLWATPTYCLDGTLCSLDFRLCPTQISARKSLSILYIEPQKRFLEWWCQFICLLMNLNHLVVHLHAKFYEWRILRKDVKNTNMVAMWICQLEGHAGVRNCTVLMYDGNFSNYNTIQHSICCTNSWYD
jgi:hypothetical protein